MIERIARRAGGFAASTAMRWIGTVSDGAPDIELPTPNKPSALEKARKPLTMGVATSAVALIASNKWVRSGVERGLRKVAEGLRPDISTGSNRNGSTPSSNGSRSSNGSSHGDLSSKTRAELYEMAKKKNIAGRSSMSKAELAKAIRL